jgi:hypothetical protein
MNKSPRMQPPPPTQNTDPLASAPVVAMLASASLILAAGLCCLTIICAERVTSGTAAQETETPRSAPQPPSCYVCYDTDADTVLLSCGHGGLCVECAARLWRSDRRCPLCRRGVHQYVKMEYRVQRHDGTQ